MLKIKLKSDYYSDISHKYQTDITLEIKLKVIKEEIEYKKIKLKLKGYTSNILEGRIDIPNQTLKQMKDNIKERIKEELKFFDEEALDKIIFEEIKRLEFLNKKFYKRITNPSKIDLIEVKDEIFQFLEQREWDDMCKCRWKHYIVYGYGNNNNLEEEFGVFCDNKKYYVSENALRLYPFLQEMVL